MSKRQTIESLWSRIDVRDISECWPWLGGTNNSGYGTVVWQGKTYTAHRLAAWTFGFVEHPEAPIDRKGTGFILHECDYPVCCNPTHWKIGTYSQNQLDAYARGRKTQPAGSLHANSKLTAQQATNIRDQYARGYGSQQDIADAHGVSQRVISLIVRGETYRCA